MRCEVVFDEKIPLSEQEIKAFGELQSSKEEPSYKESDIKSVEDKEYFKGYKFAFDTVCNILNNLVDEEVLTGKQSNEIQAYMCGELCMMLFSILDNQDDLEDEE